MTCRNYWSEDRHLGKIRVLQTLTEPVFISHSTGHALPKMANLKRPDEENPEMTSPDNTIPSRARSLPAVFLLSAHITVYSGCAFGPNKNGSIDPTLRRISGNAEIERIPHQVFDLKSIVPTGQQPRVEVRLAKPGEISKAWPASLLRDWPPVRPSLLPGSESPCSSPWLKAPRWWAEPLSCHRLRPWGS